MHIDSHGVTDVHVSKKASADPRTIDISWRDDSGQNHSLALFTTDADVKVKRTNNPLISIIRLSVRFPKNR